MYCAYDNRLIKVSVVHVILHIIITFHEMIRWWLISIILFFGDPKTLGAWNLGSSVVYFWVHVMKGSQKGKIMVSWRVGIHIVKLYMVSINELFTLSGYT